MVTWDTQADTLIFKTVPFHAVMFCLVCMTLNDSAVTYTKAVKNLSCNMVGSGGRWHVESHTFPEYYSTQHSVDVLAIAQSL